MMSPARIADRIASGRGIVAKRWNLGLDLGRVRDRSAIVGIESSWDVRRPDVVTHAVRLAEAWGRGTPLTQVVADLAELLCAPDFLGAGRDGGVTLGFDVGGLGQGLRDQLQERKPSHVGLVAVTWSGGNEATRGEFGQWSVPPAVAVDELRQLLEDGTLLVADGLANGERLLQEWGALRAGFGKRGQVTIELARTALGHSDLGSAGLLAVFLAARGAGSVGQIRWFGGEDAPVLTRTPAPAPVAPLARPTLSAPPDRPPRTSRPGLFARLLRRPSRWGRTDSLYQD